MKLLSKNEIAALKAVDRKREIDEGVKLAKKVDSLREMVAVETASVMKFREEKSILQTDIIALVSARGELMNEINALKVERVYLKKKIEIALSK